MKKKKKRREQEVGRSARIYRRGCVVCARLQFAENTEGRKEA
jgi:hypothetical protein